MLRMVARSGLAPLHMAPQARCRVDRCGTSSRQCLVVSPWASRAGVRRRAAGGVSAQRAAAAEWQGRGHPAQQRGREGVPRGPRNPRRIGWRDSSQSRTARHYPEQEICDHAAVWPAKGGPAKSQCRWVGGSRPARAGVPGCLGAGSTAPIAGPSKMPFAFLPRLEITASALSLHCLGAELNTP